MIVIKSEREIKLMEEAGQVLAKVFEEIEPLVVPGVSTQQLNDKCEQIIRGEGDARAAAIFADAYGKSPEFYSYQRWLETLRKGLEKNSSLILSNSAPLLNLQR